MADITCDICGRSVRKSSIQSCSYEGTPVNLCPQCWSKFEPIKYNTSSKEECLSYFNSFSSAESSPEGKGFISFIHRKYGGQQAADRKEEDNSPAIMLTTAPSLEGYRIIRQCGIVFGETVFKHGAFSTLGAALDNIGIGSRELTGSVSLIEEARKFAYCKMIKQAKQRGANAIIAIDSDNTIGNDVMYLSLYGTAVQVIPEAEYPAQNNVKTEPPAE